MSGFATKRSYDVGSGLSGRQWDHDNTTAPRANLRRPDDGVLGVVPTLHENIGTQTLDELERCILVEEDDAIHHLERGDDIRALRLRANGTRRALQTANRIVAIEADDQRVASPAGAKQNVDVSRMEQIEDAVGEYDAPVLGCAPACSTGPVVNLGEAARLKRCLRRAD